MIIVCYHQHHRHGIAAGITTTGIAAGITTSVTPTSIYRRRYCRRYVPHSGAAPVVSPAISTGIVTRIYRYLCHWGRTVIFFRIISLSEWLFMSPDYLNLEGCLLLMVILLPLATTGILPDIRYIGARTVFCSYSILALTNSFCFKILMYSELMFSISRCARRNLGSEITFFVFIITAPNWLMCT